MKIRINNIPVVLVLSVFSWLIAIFGLAAAGYSIVSGAGKADSIIIGCLILLGGILLAAIIRAFGNITQLLFDLRSDLRNQSQSLVIAQSNSFKELNNSLSTQMESLFHKLTIASKDAREDTGLLDNSLKELNNSLSTQMESLLQKLTVASKDAREDTGLLDNSFKELNNSLSTNIETLENILERISCDSKDANQSIGQIKGFFEQIERHLDLKK